MTTANLSEKENPLDQYYTKEFQREVFGVAEAYQELRPGCKFELYNTQLVKWDHPEDPPSWEEVLEVYTRHEKEWQDSKYARDRKEEYVSVLGDIEAQLNGLWDDIDTNGRIDKDSEWYKKIKDIKEKYPKP